MEPADDDLSDDALGADAASRPRQRKATEPSPAHPEPDLDPGSDTDEPAWAHHSQVDAQQLTPMLRHYVDLKPPSRAVLL